MPKERQERPGTFFTHPGKHPEKPMQMVRGYRSIDEITRRVRPEEVVPILRSTEIIADLLENGGAITSAGSFASFSDLIKHSMEDFMTNRQPYQAARMSVAFLKSRYETDIESLGFNIKSRAYIIPEGYISTLSVKEYLRDSLGVVQTAGNHRTGIGELLEYATSRLVRKIYTQTGAGEETFPFRTIARTAMIEAIDQYQERQQEHDSRQSQPTL